jgi:hypothetical protein
MQFELFDAEVDDPSDPGVYFVIHSAGNLEEVATSKVYRGKNRRRNANKAMRSIIGNAHDAMIVDRTT